MKNNLLLVVVTSIFFTYHVEFSFAESINLINYARITASDTQKTFFGLWPRETDDAPYTIRDDDLNTGWKVPLIGRASLTIDFAPILPKAPKIASFLAIWESIPALYLDVEIFDYCGGKRLYRSSWTNLSQPFLVEPAIEAFCVKFEFKQHKPAQYNLLELFIFAEEENVEPSISDVSVAISDYEIEMKWNFNESTCFVQIHFLRDISQPLSSNTLIESIPANLGWVGPSPIFDGYIALVPTDCSGKTGKVQFFRFSATSRLILENSGVVEGFYGRPWAHVERRKIILRLAQLGLGLYIYAPKNDPLHRKFWRIPYFQSDVERFLELKSLGELFGVKFAFGISPGLDMVLDDPHERSLLLNKLAPFAEGGVHSFALLFDDIEWFIPDEVDEILASKHVELANWLRRELSKIAGEEVELFFVPTVYSTQRQNSFPRGSEYLDVLANLDGNIKVMWTGTDTFSPTLSARDLIDVTNRIRRKPVIWENEHATDGGDMFYGKVYLAPYMNRSPDLVEAIEGIVANPMILGSANRIIMGTYAEYLNNPEFYLPDLALEKSALLEGVTDIEDSLILYLAKTFYGNGAVDFEGFGFPRNLAMEFAIDAFKSAISSSSLKEILVAGYELLKVASRMATTQEVMHHSLLEVYLVDDLWFPSYRLKHEGYALLYLLDWVGSQLAGSSKEYYLQKAEDYLWLSFFDRYQLSFFKLISFWLYLKNLEIVPVGFIRPTISEPEVEPIVGEIWSYTPCPTCVFVDIHGLPGAYVLDGTVFWEPLHPGIYKAVVIAMDNSGWAWKEIAFVAGFEEKEVDEVSSEGCGCSLL